MLSRSVIFKHMYMHVHHPVNFRHLSSAILLLSGILIVIQTIDYINFTVDDVFIPLRIAENAAQGHGFVYNKGDFIEGHSDPLWVAISAGFSFLEVGGRSDYTLLWLAKGLSYIFGLLSMIFTYRLLKKLLSGSPAKHLYAAIGVLALVICSPFVLWSCSGLEMTMVAFLYLMATDAVHAILSAERPRSSSFFIVGLTFTLASLTRPEAPLFAAAAFTFLLFAVKQRRTLFAFTILPYIVACGVFLLWRYLTYGDLLPSAFYAKTSNGLRSFVLGTKYFLGSVGGICGPLILALPFAFSRTEALGKLRAFIITLIGATMIFTIYSSGDWMPAFRFLVLVAPLLTILGILGIRCIARKISSERPGTGNALYLFTSIFLVSITNVFVMRDLIRGNSATMATGFSVIRGYTEVDHERVARWLKERLRDNETVATGEAGLIGFLNPGMRLLDLNGLMDRKIAHDRKAGLPFDAGYVIGQAPEFIVLYGLNVVDKEARALPVWGDYSHAIVNHPEFARRYDHKAGFVSFDIYQKKSVKITLR